MRRLITGTIIVGAVALGLGWVAERPGHVALDWQGLRIETSALALLLAFLVVLGTVLLLYRLWHGFHRSLATRRSNRQSRRRDAGLLSFAHGMVAVAAGDARAAARHAAEAHNLLHGAALTRLLSAQAEQLNQDDAAAAEHYQAMLAKPETEFLGLRGLIAYAARRGDVAEAHSLTRRAHALKPDSPWAIGTLFDMEVRRQEWSEAEALLDRAVKQKVIGEGDAARKRAVLRTARALALRDSDAKTALADARLAVKLAPDLVPAACLLSDLLRAAGKPRRAGHALADAWWRQPHPEIAARWLALYDNESPAKRFARAQELARPRPDHPETHYLLANGALLVGNFAMARSEAALLDPLVRRTAALLAEIDARQYADRPADGARRIAALPVDLAWTCRACQHAADSWSALCPHCGAFDSLVWTRPAAHPGEMLPAPALAAAMPTSPALSHPSLAPPG